MQRNRSGSRAFPLLVLLLAIVIVAPSFAQTFRGDINGTITDPSGAVVPGAKVLATEVATSVSEQTVSSGAGEFTFNNLPLGTYTIKVQATGFQTTEVTGVQVLAGKVYTLPIKLPLAQQATTVEVAADALSLDTTTATQTTTLDSVALQDAPLNGRDFTQLIGTSATFAGYNSTNGSVNGMRGNQINYTINGTDNNDLYLNVDAVNQGGISGIAGVVYPVDALDEFSLQTTGNSESGRSPGGNLNVSTKSGTNQFHGDAYYYNRNEALAVTSPFVTPGSPELPLRNQNFGGSVGGPIWRDHTFFFLTYEEQKFVIGESNTVTEPSPAYQTAALAELSSYGVQASPVSQAILSQLWDPAAIANLPANPGNYSSSAPQSGYSHNLVAHIDHNFSEKSHVSAIWYFGQGYAVAPDCVFVCGYLPEYFQTVPSHIENFNTVWNYSIRPNLSNQLAAGVNYFMQGFSDAVHSQNPLTLAGLNTGATLSGAPQILINGFDSIGITPTSGRNDISGQIADTLSWTVGKHEFRFGLEYRRAYIDLYYNWGARGAFNFGTGPSVLGPWASDTSITDPNILTLADFLAGYAYTSTITLGTQERFIYTHTGSTFAEDSWQVTPKLNINLGLRYDYEQPFYTNDPNLSTFDPGRGGLVVADAGTGTPQYIYNSNKTDFSPRVGLSYQVRNGTVVRANYGIFFDQPAGQAFFGNIGIPNQGSGGANNNPVGSEPNESIVLNTPSAAPIWTYNQATPIFTAAQGQPTGNNVVSIYSVSGNFKTPYAELFGLNIEQSLGKAWLFNVGYVGSVSRHNLVLQDINQNALGADQDTSTVIGPNGLQFSYQQSTRPFFSQYPNFGIINQINSAATSSYNALQATLHSSSWHGLTSDFAYTWSHNLDDSSVFNNLPQNSANLAGDWGNAEYDIRNHFAAFLTYEIPARAYGPKALTHGWEVNGILKFQNGEPVNVLTGADNSGTAEGEDRADITGPALNSNRSIQKTTNGIVAQYLNPNSFAVPANGTYGNLGRYQVIGPGFGDVDLSLIKNTPIYKERVRAQFRVEMFNVFNRVNLSQPDANIGGYGPLFGASTSTIGTQYGAPGIGPGEPYNTQLALKILF